MILDGKKISELRNEQLKKTISNYIEKGYRKPSMAIIMVGNNPASASYVKNKIKAAANVGIDAKLYHLDETVETSNLIDLVDTLNNDEDLEGFIIQLPLPKHIDEKKVLSRMDVSKDVDGFHVVNQGLLFQGKKAIYAATPQGILNLLEAYDINVSGMNAVVVGRSNIVGMPIAKLLLDHNATVTICHSKTKDLKSYTLNADLLVVAIGKASFITSDMIKKNAIVIDVGINKVDGKLVGDVDFLNSVQVASYITPVPKGVGPMTINALLENVFKIYVDKHPLKS